jgi:hypothetical protein
MSICSWSTYNLGNCKKVISKVKFCELHGEIIQRYKKLEENDLCQTSRKIKLCPRSYKQIKEIMKSMNNEDDIVDVYLAGGVIEEANLSNPEYIELVSDSAKFYYNPQKGQKKADKLKIILVEYCQNQSIVSFDNVEYCETCFKKLKDVPKISLIYNTF